MEHTQTTIGSYLGYLADWAAKFERTNYTDTRLRILRELELCSKMLNSELTNEIKALNYPAFASLIKHLIDSSEKTATTDLRDFFLREIKKISEIFHSKTL